MESLKVIALSPWDSGFPESSSYLPRNLILAGGPKGPRDFVFPGPPSKLLGSPEGGAGADWGTRLALPLILPSSPAPHNLSLEA